MDDPALVMIGLLDLSKSSERVPPLLIDIFNCPSVIKLLGKFTFKDSITSPIVINFRVIS